MKDRHDGDKYDYPESIDEIIDVITSLAKAVGNINDEVDYFGDNSPMEDFYYKNTRKIDVRRNDDKLLHRFCLDEFESLDFLAVVSSSADDRDNNNDLRLNLYQEGRGAVVTSVDDGEARSDDNSSLALHYKTKVGPGTTCFALKARATRSDREIPVAHLQVGYKTYGPGHDLTVFRD